MLLIITFFHCISKGTRDIANDKWYHPFIHPFISKSTYPSASHRIIGKRIHSAIIVLFSAISFSSPTTGGVSLPSPTSFPSENVAAGP